VSNSRGKKFLGQWGKFPAKIAREKMAPPLNIIPREAHLGKKGKCGKGGPKQPWPKG